MNDKTAIEKALRGLLWLIDQGQLVEKEKSMCGPAIVHHAREAIAALDAEKPGEDAREVARIVHEECFVDISQTTSTPSQSLIWDINTAAHVVKSFAASYHAEQCRACSCNGCENEGQGMPICEMCQRNPNRSDYYKSLRRLLNE